MFKRERILIEKLILLDKNPRKITNEQFKKLCKSIDEDPEFFDLRPCLVNRVEITEGEHAFIVYAGNQRVLAAKKLKWRDVPCLVENDLSDEIMNSRVIKDNKHYGEFDFDILANEWEMDILIDAGFTEKDFSFLIPEEKPEKEKKEEKEKEMEICPKCGFEM